MSDITFDFTGKNVLVVGGSRGIGKEVVTRFLESNANVFYTSRSKSDDFYIAKAKYVFCDIVYKNNIDQLFDFLDHVVDKLDFVINVAGTNLCDTIENINEEEWDRVLDINLKSFFIICKYAVERMKKTGGGRIVNVSSIAGRNKSIVSGVHYTASKAGIIGLTRQLAHEVSKDNILVNCVCPSQTMTDMLKKSMTKKQIDELSKKIPIGRIASMREQAYPILFLCSSAASYITGSIIDVNGGQL